MLLYPFFLRISTPTGLVDFSAYPAPPEALEAQASRAGELVQYISGRGQAYAYGQIPGFSAHSSGSTLTLASVGSNALPWEMARHLKALRPWDTVEITENLTNREQVTVWQNAYVLPDSVSVVRQGGGRSGQEWYSYQAKFFHAD